LNQVTAANRRVVITGIGVISPLGNSLDTLWEALVECRSGVRPIKSMPAAHLPCGFGGEADQFTGDIRDFGELAAEQKKSIRKGLKVMCREIQMGVAAAQWAISQAAIKEPSPDRSGVVFGSDHITTSPEEFIAGVNGCGAASNSFDYARWAEDGLPRVTPLWMLKYLPNMPASHVAIYNDFRGPNNSLICRDSSSNLAVGEAYATIVRGSADRMIAGASGGCIHPLKTVHLALQLPLAGNGAAPETAARPFDLKRTGMVLGEGAGALMLEERDMAILRGARILGEVLGHASSVCLAPNGAARTRQAIRNAATLALRKAGLSPGDIGHVHAHGLGARSSDAEEATAIREVFGENVPVVAAKSYFGNLGAASGLVELICSLLALEHGHLFPVLNYETPDPACPIRPVLDLATPAGDTVLNINFTPQGQASCVIVGAVS
jgi:3-oxoacyl-[acyl-carrier-protein] synthase II